GDGTGVNQNSVATGGGSPGGLAVDSGHLYWVNRGSFTIGRAGIDGTGVNQNFVATGAFPEGLAVDAGHLYWAHVNLSPDPNAFDDAIGRANLDRTAADHTFILGALNPAGLADGPHAAATAP